MNRIIIFASLLILCGCHILTKSASPADAQSPVTTINLEKMSESGRNEWLSAKAKVAVLEHFPEYYRDDVAPIIGQDTVRNGQYKGRSYYFVIYPYGAQKEREFYTYTVLSTGEVRTREMFFARVAYWSNTGEFVSVEDPNNNLYEASSFIEMKKSKRP